MATEVTQREIEPGDPVNDVLNALAGGKPFLFVVASADDEGHIDLKIETGGGVRNTEDIRNILRLTEGALT
jgi:phosphoribosylformimino-5-aminoimidazole carboxamide ribonucleotide (ProFAR) isomerase